MKAGGKRLALRGVAIAVLVVILAAPFASSFPDGLEKVAEHLGFSALGEVEPALKSPLPDYSIGGEGRLDTIAAGLVGVALTFGASVALGILLRRKSR